MGWRPSCSCQQGCGRNGAASSPPQDPCRQTAGPGCRRGMRGGRHDLLAGAAVRVPVSSPQAPEPAALSRMPAPHVGAGRRAAWRTRSRRARGPCGRTSACGAPPGAPGPPVHPSACLRACSLSAQAYGRALNLLLSCVPMRALPTVTTAAARALPAWPTGVSEGWGAAQAGGPRRRAGDLHARLPRARPRAHGGRGAPGERRRAPGGRRRARRAGAPRPCRGSPAVRQAEGGHETAKRALCFGRPLPRSVHCIGPQVSLVLTYLRDMLAMLTPDPWRPHRQRRRALSLCCCASLRSCFDAHAPARAGGWDKAGNARCGGAAAGAGPAELAGRGCRGCAIVQRAAAVTWPEAHMPLPLRSSHASLCSVRAAERDVQRAVALKMGKAANVLDRVVAGRMHKARAVAASTWHDCMHKALWSHAQGARRGRARSRPLACMPQRKLLSPVAL